eukprot:TRINITY_DN5214_c0_g6_i1.p1 TRINITY_DN5214_c0_g6~~TRINITY_DN5214_c0_g6_i1.p1  ORF type:complete len:144 (+),score=36.18 TRINITY_DN5214_c0_g6_i1:40-432(+)
MKFIDMKCAQVQSSVIPVNDALSKMTVMAAQLEAIRMERDELVQALSRIDVANLQDRIDLLEKRPVLDGSRISSWADEVPEDHDADILIPYCKTAIEDCDSNTKQKKKDPTADAMVSSLEYVNKRKNKRK